MKQVRVRWFKIQLAPLTRFASIEFHPHGDASVPAPRVNTDEPRVNWWRERLQFDTVLIVVTTETLKIE